MLTALGSQVAMPRFAPKACEPSAVNVALVPRLAMRYLCSIPPGPSGAGFTVTSQGAGEAGQLAGPVDATQNPWL